jgi:hypothetical protein
MTEEPKKEEMHFEKKTKLKEMVTIKKIPV